MVDGNAMINILYEDNHILVVEKPINMPVQADSSKDMDLLSILKKYIKEKYHKPGEVYLGLVHRLDRPVGGVMVFARTSKAAKRLSKQIQDHLFEKTYYAVVEGHTPIEDTLIDYLCKDPKTNTSYVHPQGKKAILHYKRISYKQNFSLVEIHLETGRSHQIRVQFSSRKYPLYGDQRYNKNTSIGQIALFAKELSFYHPVTKEKIKFSLPLPTRYPFHLFP